MKRYVQHDLLKISHFQSVTWDHPEHNHNHFEIIFIHRGKGRHEINGIKYPYEGKTLFLLSPADSHSFDIDQESEFTFLKFTNQYLRGINTVEVERGWNECIDGLLASTGKHHEEVLKTPYDRDTLDSLLRLIVTEWRQQNMANEETIFFLMQAVMAIIKRNACQIALLNGNNKPDATITELVNYIHNHIYDADKVQVEQLADTFGYSKNYLGTFFKEQLGITLRDYISEYKIKLIENRLRQSSLTIKEISYQMGFTDMSHFNKFFQKHKGVSPREFRMAAGAQV